MSRKKRLLLFVPFVIFCVLTCAWALIKAPYDYLVRGEFDWIDVPVDYKHLINGGKR